MEKVKVTKKDVEQLERLKMDGDKTLNLLSFASHAVAGELRFEPSREFSADEYAMMWIGSYEVKKSNTEVLQEEIEYSLNNHSMSGYAVGYRDGLKFAKNVLEVKK